MNKITVIMPCLNVVQYFKECIDSVVNQTIFQDIEVLVIDAGSIDGTYEIAEFYAAKYENIRVVISEKRSYGYQVNLGIKEAKSPYVAILETDDYAREDMYELLFRIAEEQQVDYIKADYDMFYVCRNGSKVFKRMIISKNEADYNTILDTTKNAHMHIQDFSVWKGIYRRDFLLENHIFFNESPGAAYQDIGFGQILHSHATRAYYIPDSLYRYRVGRAGASVNSGRGIVYARNEFARLLDIQSEHELFLPGVYEAMLSSFLGEFGLLEAPTAAEDESIIESARWIGEQVEDAIGRGIISEESIRTDLGEGRLD
ncbi:MAG: glycosyltransferase, partial [Lachnospiraceae bacterium]|nr:glycosyltransferase [Lachnospiraceae bacterium]